MKETGKNKTKKGNAFIKGTLVLTAAGFIVKVIGSLNWIILSRVLGGEGIGLYQMAFPLYLLALSVSSAGIPVAISIITAEKLAMNDYRGATRVFHLSLAALAVTGLFFALLLFFGADWLIRERYIRDPRAYYSLIALSPAIFFVTILSSFRGYLQGWQIMTPTAVSQIAEQLFRVAAMLCFAGMLLRYGIDYAAGGASLGAVAGALAGLVVLLYYYMRLQRQVKNENRQDPNIVQERDSSVIKRVVKLALPVSLSSIMLPVVANLDLLIVPARLETAGFTVGKATELFGYLTGMAVPLVNLATILTASLATSLVPAISEACAMGSRQQIYQKIQAAMRLANAVTIPGFVILLLLAEPVTTLVYNAPLASSSIQVLAVAVFLLGIHQVTTGVLQGMGHTTIPVVNMGVSAVAKVALNWTLTAIPYLGIKGAAWATVADIGIAALLNLYFIHQYTGYHLQLCELAKNFISGLVMGIVVYATYHGGLVLLPNNTVCALLAVITGCGSYTVAMVMSGCVDAEDIGRIPLIGRMMLKVLSLGGLLHRRD